MGYFVTKISVKKAAKTAAAERKAGRKRTFRHRRSQARKVMCTLIHSAAYRFCKTPACRFCAACEFSKRSASRAVQEQPDGRLRRDRRRVDACPKPWPRPPRLFNRLYVNMIKAGEAGGALEIILQRLAEFQERSQSLKRKIKGAMIYPIVVISVAVGILTFIMIKIVPSFKKIFDDFDSELPPMTKC